MQTLKVSVSLPDASHPGMELRLCANDGDCDVVIALPVQAARAPQRMQLPGAATGAASARDDEYALGGYAGI